MGYSHYWSIKYGEEPADAFGRTLLDAKRIIDFAVTAGFELSECGTAADDDKPVLAEGIIALDGVEDESAGTFVFEGKAPPSDDYGWIWGAGWDGPGWCVGHVKTYRRQYDPVVCCILARAAMHYGDSIRVRSDGEGEWDEELQPYATWLDAKALYFAVFGEDMPRPFTTVPLLEVA